MQSKRVWARVLGVETGVVIEHVDSTKTRARSWSGAACARARAVGADAARSAARAMTTARAGAGGGRWTPARSRCSSRPTRHGSPVREHGVTVAAVPWARHGAGHTRAFDDQVAWLVTHTSKTAVVELMRIAWRTVGAIAARVVDDARAARDPFDGLTRIGIDEISYRRGHKYLMVVVDHDTGRLVWAAEGHDRKTLQTVLRPARPRALRQDPPGQRRRGRMDRRRAPSTPARTRRCAWTRSTSCAGPPRPSMSCDGGCGTCSASSASPARPHS